MLRSLLFSLLTLAGGQASAQSSDAAALRVLATLPTYGSLAQALGGPWVDVVTLCRPGQDVHGVSATPAVMARARHADLLLYTGLDAEDWLEPLLRASDNADLLPGSPRALVLSDGIALKQVPAVLSRASGDVHAFGNVHVWTDPYHVRTMAGRIKDALVTALPEHADEIRARHAAFHERLTRALIGWLTEFRDLAGQGVVVHHPSWIYLLDRFGLVQAATLEPKPRVAPTAAHLDALVDQVKREQLKVIVREPFQFVDAAEFVAERTGARVLELSTHPGFPEGTEDVIDHFEHNLTALREALRGEPAPTGNSPAESQR